MTMRDIDLDLDEAHLVRRLVADGETIAERPVRRLDDLLDWTDDDQADVRRVLDAGYQEVIVAIFDPTGALGAPGGLLRVMTVEHRPVRL